jgi:hypothetical protein
MIIPHEKPNAGMFNFATGKYNPSRDDFRYDSSNSLTAMDFITSGIGIRRFGIGGKPPILIRGANKGAEIGFKASKGIYRGTKRGLKWRNQINQAIKNKLKPVNYTPRLKSERAVEGLKRVGRIANSRKGRLAIGIATATALRSGSNQQGRHTKTDLGTSGILIRKKKEKKRTWLQ